LFGTESRTHFTFLHPIWHHTTTLRRCFRESLTRQLNDGIGNNSVVRALVSEVKSDLQSIRVKEIINELVILQSLPSAETVNDFTHASSMYALLLHRFCWYLIVMLEEESILGSLTSIRVASSASALLPLIDDAWLVGDLVQMPPPLHQRRGVVVRILWMAGLVLGPKSCPEGSCPCPWSIVDTNRFQVGYLSNRKDRRTAVCEDIGAILAISRNYSRLNASQSPLLVFWTHISIKAAYLLVEWRRGLGTKFQNCIS
jgi:hypothetical protein